MYNINKVKSILSKILQAAVSLLMLILTLLFFIYQKDVTIDKILQYTPKNYFTAALFIISMFAVKSLLVILPIPVLYICVGIIFEPFTAMIVNILGMIACTTVPYWIGRYSGVGFTDWVMKKYPIARQLETYKKDNEWFFSFLVRVIGFLPCDIVSIILGSLKVGFIKYITGTIVGMLPGLIVTTFVGITITNPRSPEFIMSCIITVVISLASIYIYKKVVKPKDSKEEKEVKEEKD